MKVLLIGSGGREHALAWALLRGGNVRELVAVPGNPGIAALEGARCTEIEFKDRLSVLADLAEHEEVDLTVVGPEEPLVQGIADIFVARNLRLFGPTADAAQLEGSKTFAKNLMLSQGVPTADAKYFEGSASASEARAHLRRSGSPWVIKADGLAGGKGVLVTENLSEAERWIDDCLINSRFGNAGTSILIEEYLEGPELSLLAASDGKEILPLPTARDHKRLLDDDRGPNTGGMGAYSPVPEIDDDLTERILDTIIEPVLAGLGKEGSPYKGVIYAGLILTESGPKVLEFNVRFGDPEAQAILPRLESDLAEILLAATEGTLGRCRPTWRPEACVTIVAATDGYPESPKTGATITGIDDAQAVRDVFVFHAGTSLPAMEDSYDKEAPLGDLGLNEPMLRTASGRVLAVSALGTDLRRARDRAYDALSKIKFDGMQFRTDIALAAATREEVAQ